MNEVETEARAPVSRRTVLRGAGALGAGLLAQTALLHPAAAGAASVLTHRATQATEQTERIQDILDILATNEAFGVTLVGTVLDSAKNGTYSPAIPAKVLKVLTGVRAEEQFHLDFLRAAGGQLRTDTFYLADPLLLTDPHTLFTDLVAPEDAAIAAVMASMLTFTRERRIDLLKANFQFATEEAEHRLLANHSLGTRPANDQAFAPALFTTVAEFYAELKKKGIIDGSGKKITYPGPGPIDSTNVIYRTPGGPQVSCAAGTTTTQPSPSRAQIPAQMPNTGGGYGATAGHGGLPAPWGLLGVSALGAATVTALTQLRTGAPSADQNQQD
ncbi:MAG: hypothetical protein ACR2JY_06045 [Chloroflexota bacterium]